VGGLVNNSSNWKAGLPLVEIAVLLASLLICVWAWDGGGALGLVGCLAGAIATFRRGAKINFGGAIAGLWAGIMLGGLLGGGFARLLAVAGQR